MTAILFYFRERQASRIRREYTRVLGTRFWYAACIVRGQGKTLPFRIYHLLSALAFLFVGLSSAATVDEAPCDVILASLIWAPSESSPPEAKALFATLTRNFPKHDFLTIGGRRTYPSVLMVVPWPDSHETERFILKTPGGPAESTQTLFRNEVTLLENAPRTHFIEMLSRTKSASDPDYAFPFFTTRFYAAGDLHDNLKELGPEFNPREMLALFRQPTEAIHYLHQRGWGHSDVKPENFVVEKTEGKITKILTMDLGGAIRFRASDDTPLMMTIAYLDVVSLRRWGLTKIGNQVQQRDLDALRRVNQEMLLGKSLSEVATMYLDPEKAYHGTIYSLASSPHTINPRIDPILSALSFIRFTDTTSRLAAIQAAEEAFDRGRPEIFFQQVLKQHQAENRLDELVELIATQKEFADAHRRNLFGIAYSFVRHVMGNSDPLATDLRSRIRARKARVVPADR